MKHIFKILVIFILLSNLPSLAADKLTKPWIGIQIGELTRDLAINYGYYPNMSGAFVHYVFPAGPASTAGIKSGDIIISIDGVQIISPKELAAFIGKIKYKKSVKFTVFRNGSSKNIKVTVINNPYSSSSSSKYGSGQEKPWFGISLKNIDKEMSEIWDFPVSTGVLVVNVYEDSAACKAGIVTGDIIVEVDGNTVRTYEELLAIVTPLKPGKTIKLGIWHNKKKVVKEVTF
ncbi:MAG: PDZ domain-containing protein [Candidatus Eremiobacterota bacterium]